MTYELEVLFGASIFYLIILFFVAYVTDSGMISERWTANPLVYVLSLGVYATSWSYYGSVGFAEREGYQFLTVYLGVTIAFLFSPFLLRPILRLTWDYQLTSLADLLAFRFRSQFAGVLVTIFMLVGSLPYIALQIRAVTSSIQVLTTETAPSSLALGFCALLTLFSILFGARHISPREKHRGLVAAIAFESLVKVIALLLVGGLALFGVFSGPGELALWLNKNPEATRALYEPVREGPWVTLLFLSFCAAFLLPRQFHMTFTENNSFKSLSVASWAFPLLLLLLNLAIPPILWAGNYLQLDMDADYYVLGITLARGPDWMPMLAFIGGVSAASAMVIVSTQALSSMCLNHLLLPTSYPDPKVDIYRWLLWGRRLLIGIIIFAGFIFYELLEHNQGLVQLGLISFVAVAQFLPGIIGVLYWRRATRLGFITGLLGGITAWSITLLIPLLENSGLIETAFDIAALQQASGLDHWQFSTFCSLSINTTLFILVSIYTRQSLEEKEAALACRSDATMPVPLGGVVTAGSPAQFSEGLAGLLGKEAARQEVKQALQDLDLDLDLNENETRPRELKRLRERIERNLSGLVGPHMAHMIISQQLQMDSEAKTAVADSIRYMEERLEESRSRLRGVNADLDTLRRYQRQILLDLPLGVCAVAPDHTVVIWNLAMELMTGVPSKEVMGRKLNNLPEPWNELLAGFALAIDEHIHHMEILLTGRTRWYNLHKASIPDPDLTRHGPGERAGLVMLLEDLTDLETLEAELAHSDRLASVGRLAAGVAHEIGNPVTGIASLAQNLREENDPAIVSDSIESILQQTRRISSIVQSLMSFSRSGSVGGDYETFVLNDIIEEAIQLVALTRSGKQVSCGNSCPTDIKLVGDRQRLSQVMVNLLTNACDASGIGDRVEIFAFAEEGQIQLEVMDQGAGIPEEALEEVFEPFFTTKAPGEGTGLGLPMVYKIIQEHSGQIDIDSVPGIGTRVVIKLPQHSDQQTNE
ncbi:ATP-binding protein [Solemya velesiana gill symbiont]|uniref:histidine kinase n=1 Tax=Solemya velesiana gill symbiont TaxID=1918948 RepID=A0A1T2KWT8_9GAMM|nr:ATP-binding protein [Solemya velesiana gill symbiont]OOZ37274.1 histidine kinase [Solemya velesiana gill symbiont]